jgi:hypothetical protein
VDFVGEAEKISTACRETGASRHPPARDACLQRAVLRDHGFDAVSPPAADAWDIREVPVRANQQIHRPERAAVSRTWSSRGEAVNDALPPPGDLDAGG